MRLTSAEYKLIGMVCASRLPKEEIQKIIRKKARRPTITELQDLLEQVSKVHNIPVQEVLSSPKRRAMKAKEQFIIISALKYAPGVAEFRKLGGGVLFASELANILGLTQTTISRHVSKCLHFWNTQAYYRNEILEIGEKLKVLQETGEALSPAQKE
jgi:DNA-binding transcriptional ArsR family regulator